MVWTYLRACYRFNMRLFVGGVEQIYPARWFFCDPDAQRYPSPHGAEASPWLKQFETNLDWGDTGDLKQLDRGINPGYPGVCSVGESQWFLDGQLPGSILTSIAPQTPACCGHTPPFNSDPRCPLYRTLVPCTFCADGSVYSAYYIRITGATGIYAYYNGVHAYRYTFNSPLGFEFESVEGFDDTFLWFGPFGNGFTYIGQQTGSGAIYGVPPPFDCLDVPRFLPLQSVVGSDDPGTAELL